MPSGYQMWYQIIDHPTYPAFLFTLDGAHCILFGLTVVIRDAQPRPPGGMAGDPAYTFNDMANDEVGLIIHLNSRNVNVASVVSVSKDSSEQRCYGGPLRGW